MEALFIVIALAIVVLPLGLSIAAFVRSGSARNLVHTLQQRVSNLEAELRRLQAAPPSPARAAAAEAPPARWDPLESTCRHASLSIL